MVLREQRCRSEANVYYHVVGVWDKAAGKLHCYVNGELKKSVDCAGIKHMTTSGSRARAFAIAAIPSRTLS